MSSWDIGQVQPDDTASWWNAYFNNDMNQPSLLMLKGNNETFENTPQGGTFQLKQGQGILFPAVNALSRYDVPASQKGSQVVQHIDGPPAAGHYATINGNNLNQQRVESGQFQLDSPGDVDLGALHRYPKGLLTVFSLGYWVRINSLPPGGSFNIAFGGTGPDNFATAGNYTINT